MDWVQAAQWGPRGNGQQEHSSHRVPHMRRLAGGRAHGVSEDLGAGSG